MWLFEPQHRGAAEESRPHWVCWPQGQGKVTAGSSRQRCRAGPWAWRKGWATPTCGWGPGPANLEQKRPPCCSPLSEPAPGSLGGHSLGLTLSSHPRSDPRPGRGVPFLKYSPCWSLRVQANKPSSCLLFIYFLPPQGENHQEEDLPCWGYVPDPGMALFFSEWISSAVSRGDINCS